MFSNMALWIKLILAAGVAFLLCFGMTPPVKRFAELIGAVAGDLPEPRKRRSSDAAEPFSSPAGGQEQRRKKGEKGRKA